MNYIKTITVMIFLITFCDGLFTQSVVWSSEDSHTTRRNSSFSERRRYLVADKYDTLYSVTSDYDEGRGSEHMMLRKYDNNGTLIWASRFIYGDQDVPYGSLILDDFNNIYVLAESHFSTRYVLVLLKYDRDGNLLWTRTQDNVNESYESMAMEKDEWGNIIVLCSRRDLLSADDVSDYCILKYDYNGALIWKKTLDITNQDMPRDLCVSGNNICITGQSHSFGGNWSLYVIMLNSDGVFQWQYTSFLRSATDVPVVTDGTYFYVANTTYITGPEWHITLRKLGSYGSVLWTFTEDAHSTVDCLAYDYKNQRIVIGGRLHLGGLYISEIGALWGTRIWKKIFGSFGMPKDILLKSVNGSFNIYVLGTVYGSVNADIVLLKYDASGVMVWNTFYNGVNNFNDNGVSLASGGLTDIYITGDCDTIRTSSVVRNCVLLRVSPTTTSPEMKPLDNNEAISADYTLGQNYPNPFNPSTTIKFSLPTEDDVMISVSDISGKEVAELVNQKMSAGYHEVNFDGSGLASGIYFYRITTSGFTDVKKMILVK